MNERLLARLLFGLGIGTLGLMVGFGPHWADAGLIAQGVLVASSVASAVGIGLDVTHQREDKAAQRVTVGGSE